MGRKVYVSFLGTNDYLSCNYTHPDHAAVCDVRFVQEATIRWYCADWRHDDLICLFTTDESHGKNWLDNGHGNPAQGLGSRIASLPLQASIKKIRIPSGRTEDEIWDIFSTVFEQLREGDKLFLDITHAFRSLPLLAMVILNYAKATRNITVQSINYGAMEALGTLYEVKDLPLEKRNVPVFNLLPFDQLLDWTTAIDRFIGTGDPTKVSELTARNITPVLKKTEGKDQDAAALRGLHKALVSFSQTIATCRGKNIVHDAASLKKNIILAQNQEQIKPLKPLLEQLASSVQSFSGDEVRDGIAACRWCLRHNLVQQGFTLLEETMITWILVETIPEGEHKKEKFRNLVGMALKIYADDLPVDQWSEGARNNEGLIEQIIRWLKEHPSLAQHMKNLIQERNDLNHAGYKDNAMKADLFHQKLKEHIDILSQEIESTFA